MEDPAADAGRGGGGKEAEVAAAAAPRGEKAAERYDAEARDGALGTLSVDGGWGK